MRSILVADIGGTNSRFAKVELKDAERSALTAEMTVPSKAVDSFQSLLGLLRTTDFWNSCQALDGFVIAMTGPVREGKYCRSANLAWDVDLDRDRAALPSAPVWLINDFLAQAFAAISPIAGEAEAVLPGRRQKGSVVSVIGAGTGLGEAFLVPDDHGFYLGCSSEGGHQTFAPEDARDVEFLEFACKVFETSYLEWDDVVSGRGLAVVHQFITGEVLEPQHVPARFSDSPESLSYFARYYALACRNLALTTLPYSGLYIAGGIAAKNPQIVFSTSFKEVFLASKSYPEIVSSIPVFLLDNEKSGLWGAAWYGSERLKGLSDHAR